MKKLAIVTSHPIQYNAPLFKLLSQRGNIQIKVFYTWGQSTENIYDPGFGKHRSWDIPLLEGYDYVFLENVSKNSGSHHFKGIDNPSIIAEIEAYNPNAVLVFGWSFKSHLKVLRHFKNKVPVFFRGDSTLLDETNSFSLKKIIRKLFLTWVYKHIDKAFYVGEANKAYYKKYGVKNNTLVFAPHAIDNERFTNNRAYSQEKANQWRASLGIKSTDFVFLFAGKLEPKKNPLLLIRAFKVVQREGVHLILVGNGILEDELKTIFEDIQNLHFVNFKNQSEMPIVYSMSNAFVLPSKGPYETWGLAINEAMACGKAVVVSDKCGCAKDLVEHGKNGYIFKSDDLNDLVDKMNKLVVNKEIVYGMGVESYKIITHWNYAEICKAIEASII